MSFDKIDGKLSESQNSLRKTLGYGWSVAIVSLPNEGKVAFEKIASYNNKHKFKHCELLKDGYLWVTYEVNKNDTQHGI